MDSKMEKPWVIQPPFNPVLELVIEDTHRYKEMMRIEKEQFIEILKQIDPHNSRQTNKFV